MIAGLMSNMFVSFYKCVLYDANTSIIRSPPQKTKPLEYPVHICRFLKLHLYKTTPKT